MATIHEQIKARIEEFGRTFWANISQNGPRQRLETIHDASWSEEACSCVQHGKVLWHFGVYMHIAGDGTILYVGKATGGENLYRSRASRTRETQWTEAFVFEKYWGFLVPALEAFLIPRLKPTWNIRETAFIPDAVHEAREEYKRKIGEQTQVESIRCVLREYWEREQQGWAREYSEREGAAWPLEGFGEWHPSVTAKFLGQVEKVTTVAEALDLMKWVAIRYP